MKRVLCVWLPGWPLQRLRHAQPELEKRSLVLYGVHPPIPPFGRGGEGGCKLRVSVCSARAAQRGIVPGMPLAEARALETHKSARFELQDHAADRAALRKLALSCQCFTPLVAIEEAEQPESLLLDITGCGPYFGGEEALFRKVIGRFQDDGYAVKVAIADTLGAAWALAHDGEWWSGEWWSGEWWSGGVMQEDATHHSPLTTHHSPLIVASGKQAEALRPLAVEALRLSDKVVALLHAFDLRRIEQLLALPRADLTSRFTPEVVQRLDQALGNVAELLTPEPSDEPVEASWLFDPPVADLRTIEVVLGHLLEQVLERLQPRQWGVQKLRCLLRTTAGQPLQVEVGLLQASASLKYLKELVRLHFERLRLAVEVSALVVRVAVAGPLEFHQGQLFAGDTERWRQLPTLIERLSNRLGEKAVLRPRLWPDAQPEFACRYESWLRVGPPVDHSPLTTHHSPLLRPSCLLSRPSAISVVSLIPGGPPRRFQWQHQDHRVAHAWGPERIETGWWRERDVRRDYYLVETTLGQRFWLFRTRGDERWFLHGVFG